MLDFSEIERDSRKLKKVQELVQHFCEQFRHYVTKENITYRSTDESLRSINWPINYDDEWRREKGRRKTIVCTNLKQTSTKCGAALCGVV